MVLLLTSQKDKTINIDGKDELCQIVCSINSVTLLYSGIQQVKRDSEQSLAVTIERHTVCAWPLIWQNQTLSKD